MNYYYCFACRHLSKGTRPECTSCQRGAARVTRKLKRSSRFSDTYEIYVDKKLIATQRVPKKV